MYKEVRLIKFTIITRSMMFYSKCYIFTIFYASYYMIIFFSIVRGSRGQMVRKVGLWPIQDQTGLAEVPLGKVLNPKSFPRARPCVCCLLYAIFNFVAFIKLLVKQIQETTVPPDHNDVIVHCEVIYRQPKACNCPESLLQKKSLVKLAIIARHEEQQQLCHLLYMVRRADGNVCL